MRYLLILITASLLTGGCRTIHKDASKLDSSYTQNSTINEAYERAIVTEYIEIPVEKIIERPGQIIRDTVQVPVPKIIRQTVYEKGTRKQETEAKSEVEKEEKVIKKEDPPWVSLILGFVLCFMMYVIAFILIKRLFGNG